MRRLSITGSALATPERVFSDLERYLNGLGLKYTGKQRQALYDKLGAMIGRWRQEQESMEAEGTAKALLSVCRDLDHLCLVIGGNRTGFQEAKQISAALHLRKLLAQDPAVGSSEEAERVMARFLDDASKIAQLCHRAGADLTSASGPSGRPNIAWYDEFTRLVVDLARHAGEKTTISTDRVSGERRGWILTVAEELEGFLPKPMRSPSPEARAKRLERSKRKIRGLQGQKGSTR